MENQFTPNNDEIEIDLKEIFGLLISKMWVIILSGITAGLIFIVATMLFITPQYESTTKMYVLNKQTEGTITSADMQSSLYLTKDYADLIQSRTVTEGVIAQLGLNLKHEDMLFVEKMHCVMHFHVLTLVFEMLDCAIFAHFFEYFLL